jgi:hypothetical protein
MVRHRLLTNPADWKRCWDFSLYCTGQDVPRVVCRVPKGDVTCGWRWGPQYHAQPPRCLTTQGDRCQRVCLACEPLELHLDAKISIKSAVEGAEYRS